MREIKFRAKDTLEEVIDFVEKITQEKEKVVISETLKEYN